MAINYNVKADVVAIKADTPKDSDSFLIDSNVWFWVAYSKASSAARQYQINDYPQYLNNALSKNAYVFHSGLSLAELSHLIEKTEREIYEQTNGTIRPKEYRHNHPSERSSVVTEVEAAWGVVKSLAKPMDTTIDQTVSDASLIRFKTQFVDGYDLFLLEAMQSNRILQVITDDGDFCTIPGIQVFTSNPSVIRAARSQGRLITR